MVSFKSAAVVFGTLLLSSLRPCLALPATTGFSPNYNYGIFRRAEPQDFYLRIMPLGASITAGDEAAPDDKEKNGYRKFLRDKLRADGWQINMVGNRNSGTMKDNDHEGVSGDNVKEVGDRAKQAAYFWLPNVALINAGTNDAEGDDVSGVGAQMRQVIDAIFSEVPSAVVVLSTLLPSEEYQENIDDINKQYRDLARQYNQAKDGEKPDFKVILADMADGFISLEDLHDGKHPTTEGQRKMAAVWLWAINKANDDEWFAEPSESGRFTDGDGSLDCRKELGSGDTDVRAGRQVLFAANDVIADDGPYEHSGVYREDVGGQGNGETDDVRIYFADIVSPPGQPAPVKGKERDEFIWVTGNSDDRKVKYWLNNGAGTFGDEEEIDVKDGCKTIGIHWGDVDGDALDDFICLAEDGEMFVSLNKGGSPPEFESIGSYKTPEKGLGQENVRLGDIDGDGRLDYCVIEAEGDIYCWRNDPAEWEDMGAGAPVFTAKGMGDIAGVQFVDLNGDGRYDWTWISSKGEVTTWTNQRGDDKTLIPRWLEAGVTHAAFDKEFANYGEGVVWGRILNDEKTDYIHHKFGTCTGVNNPRCDIEWEAYENQGKGGRYQKGDGIYWGDTTGTGIDDYIWISPEGEVNIFLNKNTENDTDEYETSAWGDPHNLPTELSRRALHVGDWDGDGKADIIGVTDRGTGAIKVWYSRWDDTEFDWEEEEISGDWCDQGWGLRYYDSGVHFADISGSGRVDYLCMAPDGSTTAWLRDKDGDSDAGEIKASEGLDRADYHWGDADGDGRADLIWTDKFTGDGWVYYNLGEKDGAFEWEGNQKVFQGSSRGSNMQFPNLGGQGRADMVGTDPTSGHAWIWFNSCPAGGDDAPDKPSGNNNNSTGGGGSDGNGGGGNKQDGGDKGAEDDGGVKDPNLPEYEPSSPGNDTESGDHWFCDTENAAGWNSQLWRDHNMGRWLVQRSELYLGLDADWPDDEEAGDTGVPRTIARYNGFTKDNAFDWPGTGCIDAEGTCDMPPTNILNSNCARYPERAFSLWAMRNLARVIQSWLSNFQEGVDTGSLFSAEIADKFLIYTDADPPIGAWLTLTVGFLTTLGPVTAIAGPVAALSATVIIGSAVSTLLAESPDDPRFDTFADLQSGLGDVKIMVQDGIIALFNELFVDVPPDGNWDRGTQLAGMLEDGTFASQDIGGGRDEVTSTDMTRLVQAAVISEAWNAGRMAVVKWSYDGDMANNNWNPCGTDDWAIGDDHSWKDGDLYADFVVACAFDKNHILLPLLVDDLGAKERAKVLDVPNIGQGEDTLKDYDLTHEKVIAAAERTQRRNNEFNTKSLESMGGMFTDIVENPGENMRDDLIYFNIPVCDLDTVDVRRWRDQCEADSAPKPCLVQTVSEWCSGMKLEGSDSEWPYQYKMP